MATAAIWYESDGYRLEGRPLMGRRVAGQEFLKAFARFARTDRFTAVVRDEQNRGEFVATMRELRPEIPARAITPDAMGEIAEPKPLALSPNGAVDGSRGVTFLGSVPCKASGQFGFSVRVLPKHPNLPNPFEPGLVTWG